MSDNGNGHDKRAVLYARTSYDDRDTDGRNLAGQLEMARQYAISKGYQVVAEVSEDDKGASGAAFELEGLTRIREMAAAGAFDVLIPRELDRLSRNLAKQLVVEEELKRAGVGIEYVLGEYAETPEGDFMKHVKAVVAEYERAKTMERTTRARRLKAKSGQVIGNGRIAYGYRVVRDEAKRWVYEIHEPEAQIVRFVFSWYVSGDGPNGPMSCRAIARKLTEMRVPTRDDGGPPGVKKRGAGEWCYTTINKILQREVYAGTWYYAGIPVAVPAIVSRELWAAAQKARKDPARAGRTKKYDYLLSGRIRCGACGSRMSGSGRRSHGSLVLRYRCGANGGRIVAKNCNAPGARADQVDAVVWDWVRGFLTDPARLERGLRRYQADKDTESEPIRRRLAVIDDLLTDNRRQVGRLLDLYISGDFPKDVLTDRKTRLEMMIRALEDERAGLVAQLQAATLTDDQVQDILSFAAELAPGLEEAEEDLGARRALIEKLRMQVILTDEDGQRVVYGQCVTGKEKLGVLSPVT